MQKFPRLKNEPKAGELVFNQGERGSGYRRKNKGVAGHGVLGLKPAGSESEARSMNEHDFPYLC